jgi:glycosyltransferase involved in cell wall biosynthesis
MDGAPGMQPGIRGKRTESVLFVTTSFPRFQGDFAGSFVFRFAKYLVQDGVRVQVIAPGAAGYPTTEDMEDVQVYRVPYVYPRRLQRVAYEAGGILATLRSGWLAKVQVPLLFGAMVWAICRAQKQVDLIHCHWLPTAVAALVARGLSRTKPAIVFTNWGSDTRHLPLWLTRWTVRRVEGCISTAVETDEHLLAAGRTEFRRIMAPVDEERFMQHTHDHSIRQELGLEHDIPVLAFVGRLTPFKDPLTFIRACILLKQQHVSFVALVAGDGDLMPDCQQAIQQAGLQEHIRLLGMRTDPERILGATLATVHISPIENTWANVIAEAMFMEVPVVLSDAGYTQRLFTDGENCLLVPAENPRVLAGALKRLLDDASLRQTLTTGAKALLQQYKKDRVSIVQGVRAYYDELQASR